MEFPDPKTLKNVESCWYINLKDCLTCFVEVMTGILKLAGITFWAFLGGGGHMNMKLKNNKNKLTIFTSYQRGQWCSTFIVKCLFYLRWKVLCRGVYVWTVYLNAFQLELILGAWWPNTFNVIVGFEGT